MSTALPITKLQLRIIRRDPAFLVIMFGMPLVIMPILRQTVGISLVAEGFEEANGAELAVPGQSVVFGFFVAGSVGFSVFREHGWKTWDRLRTSAASPVSLLAGFAIPWIIIHVLYQIALLVVGGLFFGLSFDVSLLAELAVITWFSFAAIAIMLFSVASFRTVNQHQAIVNLGAMVMGGLGGALVPLEQLPGWAQAIAPITPTYWVMQGHRAVFLEDGGLADVATSVAVLCAFGVFFAGFGARRFRSDETKEFFA